MKKKFYIFVAIFLVFYVIFSLNFILNPQKGFSYKILTKILPKNIKNKFRDIYYGSFNSQISNLESRLKSAEDIIKNQKNLSLDLEVGDRSKDTFIIDSLINLQIPLLFKKTKTKQKINNTDYLLSKFSNNILDNGVGAYAKASAYLDIYNNHVVVSSKDGSIFYFNIDDFTTDTLNALSIPSNIKKIIKYDKFYENKRFGVKDALIYEDKIYIAYTNQLTENCFNISVIVSKMNFDFLNFKNFFTPQDCVKKDNDYGEFSANQSGGRLFPFKNKKFLLTKGEFRYRTLAQNPNNTFGKILSISENKYDTLSLGVRNSQGLYYDFEKDVIIFSDHGPYGGDEINVHHNPSNENVKNFGWPISSYGEHYPPVLKKYYATAPLYKSHKDHGFEEPIHYYVPSITTSEIIKIPNNFFTGSSKNKNENFFLTSLGFTEFEGERSIYHIQFNNKLDEIISEKQIKIGERIRDIKYINNLEKVILFLDNTASIAILEKNK